MDGIDGTFRANFSIDGAAKLRERVRDKLKEFMGDYTDDTLVEYVIVLLRNGRQKQEAKNELNVFLGDDSDSFVSWLWDHLSSNLHLYVQKQESYPEEIAKSKPVLAQLVARSDPHQLDSGSEREKSTKHSKRRRNREWKGLVKDVAEVPPLWSSEIEIEPHSEEKMHESPHSHEKMHKRPHSKEKRHEIPIHMKRAHSPKPLIQNKRSRQDEHQDHKREVPSRPTVAASCRLLQFAVRDAVGTLKSSSSRRDPTLKRLRSVVSTSTENSYMVDQPRSVARLPSAVATAFKAAADAAEDVTKVRSSVNVFDRLGHGMDESGITNQLADFKGTVVEDAEYGDFDQTLVDTDSNYVVRNEYSPEFTGNRLMLERDRVTAYDSAYDNDAYDDVNKDVYCDDINNDAYDDVNPVRHRVMDASETGTSSGNKDDDSLMVRYNVANDMQYSVANNMNDAVRRTRIKDQNPSAPVANTSRKIVNISVNVNTWKPPHYQAPKEVREVENLEAVLENDAAASKSNVRMMENNNAAMAVNGNEKAGAPMQKESQKTQASVPSSYSIGRPSEDTDSRTIFVNNVHFAATKDTLSRHFNKFGEVLKVVIVTDAASGQPKGSAYIEFMRKEAAELALSLNGTSFMSRILKVVKKSAAYQEATNIMTWSHIARASPFAARLGRVPFPRGMPAAFRTRLPVKPGARSLQWKRDAPAATINEAGLNAQNVGALSNNSVPSPTARSLTYVRKESKPDGNLRPA